MLYFDLESFPEGETGGCEEVWESEGDACHRGRPPSAKWRNVQPPVSERHSGATRSTRSPPSCLRSADQPRVQSTASLHRPSVPARCLRAIPRESSWARVQPSQVQRAVSGVRVQRVVQLESAAHPHHSSSRYSRRHLRSHRLSLPKH
jgi:hypothetical protein